MSPTPTPPNEDQVLQALKAAEPALKAMAWRLVNTAPRHIGVDDLMQEARVGMWLTASRWVPGAASLLTFLLQRARGAMVDYIRTVRWTPRGAPWEEMQQAEDHGGQPLAGEDHDTPEALTELKQRLELAHDRVLRDRPGARTGRLLELVAEGLDPTEIGHALGVDKSLASVLRAEVFKTLEKY